MCAYCATTMWYLPTTTLTTTTTTTKKIQPRASRMTIEYCSVQILLLNRTLVQISKSQIITKNSQRSACNTPQMLTIMLQLQRFQLPVCVKSLKLKSKWPILWSSIHAYDSYRSPYFSLQNAARVFDISKNRHYRTIGDLFFSVQTLLGNFFGTMAILAAGLITIRIKRR